MYQWTADHPVLTAAIVWVVCIVLILWMLSKRGGTGTKTGTATDRDDPILGIAGLMRAGLVRRLPMRPRFVPKPHDTHRSEILAAQILADQSTAHEAPGEVTHAPAPGEQGYQPPQRTIRVTVNQWTVLLRQGSRVQIVESNAGGLDYPPYDVTEEWAPIVAALAFEVQRLREGWSVDEPA